MDNFSRPVLNLAIPQLGDIQHFPIIQLIRVCNKYSYRVYLPLEGLPAFIQTLDIGAIFDEVDFICIPFRYRNMVCWGFTTESDRRIFSGYTPLHAEMPIFNYALVDNNSSSIETLVRTFMSVVAKSQSEIVEGEWYKASQEQE